VADVGVAPPLVSSGLTSIFTYCTNNTQGLPFCPLATRSVLVGDVRLRQLRRDGPPKSEWLLHSPQAEEHLRRHPGDYFTAAKARVHALWEAGWNDDETDTMELIFTTWNERAEMFAVTEARVRFDDWGFVVPHVVARAVIVVPYPSWWSLSVDVIYVLLILYPGYGEVKDILGQIRIRGLIGGCKEYWGFWNGVDWISIIMGVTNIVIWIMFCMATRGDAIQDLLDTEDDHLSLIPNVMSLDTGALEAAESTLTRIVELFYALQLVMGVNVVSIMLKFFKAFQANPRLQLVTNTLIHAADELFHFLIVFSAIFMGFSVSGHILFGDDLMEFSSVHRSMNTAYIALLGDFGWYGEEIISDRGLGSGLPRWVLSCWFVFYSTFVVLIILNMLLAIIMDHYTELVMHVRSAADAPTIWKQTANYVKRARQSKGFIPINTLLGRLTDKEHPAHSEETVCQDSLKASFTGMKDDQATFIMNWLESWAKERARHLGDEENIARLKELSSLMQAMSSQVHVVSLNTSLVSNRLHQFQGDVLSKLQSLEANVAACSARIGELEAKIQQRPEPGSHWGRSASRSLREAVPLCALSEPLGGVVGKPGGPCERNSETVGLGFPPSARGAVAEPKLVAQQPTRPKREKAELRPCCSPAQGSVKTTIAADRRQ